MDQQKCFVHNLPADALTQSGAPTETNTPLNQRLRRLNQQFKTWMTFTHLQSIAENYNISKSIDFFSLLFERISREFCALEETLEIKSCYKTRQKRTKSLDSCLANMSFENNHLNLRQIHMQRTVLSHKIQNQQSHIGYLESLRNQVRHGMQDLLASQKTSNPYNEIGESDATVLDPLYFMRKQQGEVRHVQTIYQSPKNTEQIVNFWAHQTTDTQHKTQTTKGLQAQQFTLKRKFFNFHFDKKSHIFKPQRKKPEVDISSGFVSKNEIEMHS